MQRIPQRGRLLFDGSSTRWFADGGMRIFPAPVRPNALRLLGGGLLLAFVALAVVVVLVARVG